MLPLHFLMRLFTSTDIHLNLNAVLHLITSRCGTVYDPFLRVENLRLVEDYNPEVFTSTNDSG